MLRSSDLQSLQEAYQNIYEETDGISLEIIEEIVEELVEECVEYGYTLDEAADAVETAALLYIDEAKITYGSDTESPEQRRERAKGRLGGMKSSARKAAVKGAVERVKAKAKGAKAMAGIAGSIAKDEARRAGRAATHAVSSTVQKKKAEVKGGIKRMIGGGLRAAATGIGKVAQKAAGAAARLGEETTNEAYQEPKFGKKQYIKKLSKRGGMGMGTPEDPHGYRDPKMSKVGAELSKRTTAAAKSKKSGEPDTYRAEKESQSKFRKEEVDVFDVVLEYLLDTGHAETISEAQYIMSQMDSESIDSMLDEAMTNYEKNRKRAAQRAAARNAARDQGKTGAVPGVGYVTPRRERETWTDESGKTRHAKGL